MCELSFLTPGPSQAKVSSLKSGSGVGPRDREVVNVEPGTYVGGVGHNPDQAQVNLLTQVCILSTCFPLLDG